MTADRQSLKDWLHYMRAEVEAHAGVSDPFAPLEAEDDIDIDLFQRMATEGPPTKSCIQPHSEAAISDYAFWWIRILNAHFVITDLCGHYPYWILWYGFEWSDKDKEAKEKMGNFLYGPENETVFRQVRQDYLDGI